MARPHQSTSRNSWDCSAIVVPLAGSDPLDKSRLYEKFKKISALGVVEEVRGICVGTFEGENEPLEMEDATLIGEFEGHPGLRKCVDEGDELIVL